MNVLLQKMCAIDCWDTTINVRQMMEHTQMGSGLVNISFILSVLSGRTHQNE